MPETAADCSVRPFCSRGELPVKLQKISLLAGNFVGRGVVAAICCFWGPDSRNLKGLVLIFFGSRACAREERCFRASVDCPSLKGGTAMEKRFGVVSADGHCRLMHLPCDLWTKRLPRRCQ